MKNPFEMRAQSRIEAGEKVDNIDALIEEFPEELQDRLEKEIESMDNQTAVDYLIRKFAARQESLVEWSTDELAQSVEVTHEIPQAVLHSIESTVRNEEESLLGAGKNGKVYQSIRRDYACYKVLFPEKVKQLKLNIVKEAIMQHKMGEFLKLRTQKVHIPQVLGFVDHPRVQAILMEKVPGHSLYDILERKVSAFPEGFDRKRFFSDLREAVTILNEDGYFHMDLNNNAGNVMVDEEGRPWIVDFGSSIKALNHDGSVNSYQLAPRGARHLATDLTGVDRLEARVAAYQRERNI